MSSYSDIHELVERDRFELMMLHPLYYGRVICSTELVVVRDSRVQLACTDYRRIFISGDAYSALPENKRLAVLAHEALHIVLRHAFRIGSRDKNRFEIAADAEVHFILSEHFPDPYGITCPREWAELTAEQIYELLPPRENKKKAKSEHCSPGSDSTMPPNNSNGKPSDQQNGESQKADGKPSDQQNGESQSTENPSEGGNKPEQQSGGKESKNNPTGDNSPENGNQSEGGNRPNNGDSQSDGDNQRDMDDNAQNSRGDADSDNDNEQSRKDSKRKDRSNTEDGNGNTNSEDNGESNQSGGDSQTAGNTTDNKQHSKGKVPKNRATGENSPGNNHQQNGNQSDEGGLDNSDKSSGNSGQDKGDRQSDGDTPRSGNGEKMAEGNAQSGQPTGGGGKPKKRGSCSKKHDTERDGHGKGKSGNDDEQSCKDGNEQNSRGDELPDNDRNQEEESSEFNPQFDAETEMHCIALSEEALMGMLNNGYGTQPGNLERLLKKIGSPRIPWQVLLRQFLRHCRSESYSWSHPNRRFISKGLYLPGRDGILGFNGIVALDTSSSTIKVLPQFVADLVGLFKAFGKFSLTIMECDVTIQQVWKVSNNKPMPDILEHKFKGFGGTDFRPVFDYIHNHHLTPNVLIFFTDGEGTCIETKPPYPVLWMLTKKGTAPVPWGQAINYEANTI